MRHIGNIESGEQVSILRDYLLSLDIPVSAEQEGDRWAIWVHDEDQVEQARTEFAAFQEHPGATRFREAAAVAQRLRAQQSQKAAQARRNIVDVRSEWQRPLWQRAPLTFCMIAFSVAVAILGAAAKDDTPLRSALSIASYDIVGNMVQWEGLRDVTERFQIWRVITPIFVHAPLMEGGLGFLHLLFNMMWLKDLGSVIELRRRSLKLAGMVVAIAAISNIAQYMQSGPLFCGMSGVVFGLFGYIWMQSRLSPNSGFYMPRNLVVLMIGWFLLCLTGMFGPIANTAHGVGLAVGVVLGAVPPLLRRVFRG